MRDCSPQLGFLEVPSKSTLAVSMATAQSALEAAQEPCTATSDPFWHKSKPIEPLTARVAPPSLQMPEGKEQNEGAAHSKAQRYLTKYLVGFHLLGV